MVVYVVGLLLLTFSAGLIPSWAPSKAQVDARERASGGQSAALYIALYVIALGTGGIKPNVSSFGGDQFDPHNPVHSALCDRSPR